MPPTAQPRLALIANPNSGRHRRAPDSLREYQQLPDAVVHITQSADEIAAVCARIALQSPQLIAIAGGDGTKGRALGALRAAYSGRDLPPILPLPGGTMNMVARSVGNTGDPLRILRRALAQPTSALKLQTRNTLRVNGETGFIFGLGLVSNFLEAYYEGTRTGPVKAAELVARTIYAILSRNALCQRLFRPQRGSLRRPGVPDVDAAWTAVLVQTIENLGIGFRPMYRALAEPGMFHALGTDMSAGQLLRHLPRIFRGGPWGDVRMHDWTGNALQFAPEGAAQYTLDGELYRTGGLIEVEMGTPVQFAVP